MSVPAGSAQALAPSACTAPALPTPNPTSPQASPHKTCAARPKRAVSGAGQRGPCRTRGRTKRGDARRGVGPSRDPAERAPTRAALALGAGVRRPSGREVRCPGPVKLL